MDDEEPLESFYGDESDDVDRLAETEAGAPSRARAEPGGARKRTVTGALMAGIAMGFREVFEPEYHDRTAIEQPAPEQPTEPQRYELHLDPVAPESSFAIYRPWIDGETDGDAAPEDAEAQATASEPVPPAPAKPRGGGMGALGG